jgi:hypothetical protein
METKEALELYRMAYKRAADKDDSGVQAKHLFAPIAAWDAGKKLTSMRPQWVKDRVAQGTDPLKKGVNWAASKTPGYKKMKGERDTARMAAGIAGVGALGAGGMLLYDAIRKRLTAGKGPAVKG